MRKLWGNIQIMLVQSKGELGAESYLRRKKNGEKITHNQIANEFNITDGVLRYHIKKKTNESG